MTVMPSSQLSNLDFLWLELTPGCNLHCQHCYVGSSPMLKDPKVVDWFSMLDQARALGCRMVQFIGGEPMYHRDLTDLAVRAHQLDFHFIEVYTNLTLLKPGMLETFSNCGVHIATSFYSHRKEVHDVITGVTGSFDRTIRGIDQVVAEGLPLRVGIVQMESNAADIEEAIELLVRRGVGRSEIRVDKSRPVGRGVNLTPVASLEETLCGKCWQGKLCISSHGKCYPCVFARDLEVGQVPLQPLADIVRSPELSSTRKLLYSAFRPELAECAPECDPTCAPNRPCQPVCGPSCQPDCNPWRNCDPTCTPQL